VPEGQTPFADLPAALVEEVIKHTTAVGDKLIGAFQKMKAEKAAYRELLEKSGLLVHESELGCPPLPTTCGTDGSYAIDRLLTIDLVAAASVFLPGDGENARRIASLDSQATELLSGASIPQFYNALVSSVAVTAGGVNADVDSLGSVQSALQAQKESISGVNLDEEAVSLVKFQRAFQGASRFVSVVDQLLGDLMTLIS